MSKKKDIPDNNVQPSSVEKVSPELAQNVMQYARLFVAAAKECRQPLTDFLHEKFEHLDNNIVHPLSRIHSEITKNAQKVEKLVVKGAKKPDGFEPDAIAGLQRRLTHWGPVHEFISKMADESFREGSLKFVNIPYEKQGTELKNLAAIVSKLNTEFAPEKFAELGNAINPSMYKNR